MNPRMFHPLIWTLLCLLSAGMLAGQSRDEIMGRAQELLGKQDFPGAIAGFTELIKHSKEDGEAFYWRGYARHAAGELNGAILDYTWAITLLQVRPLRGETEKTWLAHIQGNRGKAKQDQHDWAGAAADYDAALTMQPGDHMTRLLRGSVRQITGDMAGALADSEEVIRQTPDSGNGYQQRAMIRQGQGDFDGAISDTREMIRREPQHVTYGQFFVWCLQARRGEQTAADKELAAHVKSVPVTPENEWRLKIAAFLLGQMDEEEFVRAVASPDAMKERAQRCEAGYYRGIKKLLAGDRQAADKSFREAQDTGMLYFTEYLLARQELAAAR
jgi:tetratricopeptide (TPR) repeat protein